jgi:predicted acyl esterase
VKLGPRTSGIIRARYRNGFERTELVTPGKTERYTIQLGHIGHSFLPGHRIRIEISSSAAPAYNPNQNTGNPVATDTEWKIAHQTIFHDRAHPSRLLIPWMPKRLTQ